MTERLCIKFCIVHYEIVGKIKFSEGGLWVVNNVSPDELKTRTSKLVPAKVKCLKRMFSLATTNKQTHCIICEVIIFKW